MARTEVRGGQILDGSVSLTADVTGILPVANGGNGVSTGPTTADTFANLPSAGQAGRLYYCTDCDLILRDNGSSWDRIRMGAGGAPPVAPPTTGWTSVSLVGATTVAASKDGRLFTVASGGAHSISAEYRTLSPAINYTLTAYFEFELPENSGAAAQYGGLLLRNSSSLSAISFGPSFSSSPGHGLATQKWASSGGVYGYNSTYREQAAIIVGRVPNWYRIRDDGTTRFFEFSHNGYDWIPHYSVGRTDFITPDQIGWCHSNNGGSVNALIRLRSWSQT